jgi:hypothetical protein
MFIPTQTYALNLEPSTPANWPQSTQESASLTETVPNFETSTESAYYDQNELAEAENVDDVDEVTALKWEFDGSETNIQTEAILEVQEGLNDENVETIISNPDENVETFISIPELESSSNDVTREQNQPSEAEVVENFAEVNSIPEVESSSNNAAEEPKMENLMNEPVEAHAESSENGFRNTLDRLSGKEINTFVTIQETRVINVPGNSDVVATKPVLKLDYYRNIIAEDHLHIASVFLACLVFVTVGGVIFSRFRMQQDW